MSNIKFSEEWDKLKPGNREIDRVFTTIRGYTPQKETYYWKNLEGEFNVLLKGKSIGTAKLERFGFWRPSEMPLEWLQKDIREGITEKDVHKLFYEFYGNSDPYCIMLWFKWVTVQKLESYKLIINQLEHRLACSMKITPAQVEGWMMDLKREYPHPAEKDKGGD